MSKRKRPTQEESRRQRSSQVYRERQEKERKWGSIYQQERDIFNGGKTTK